LLLDVLEILASGAAGGILLAHITEPAGELGKPLAIRTFAEPANLEVIGLDEDRSGEKRDYWLSI